MTWDAESQRRRTLAFCCDRGGGIRTRTVQILSLLSLPLDYAPIFAVRSRLSVVLL